MPKNTTCTVVDCGRTVLARGWCSLHYGRWRKHGNALAEPSRMVGEVKLASAGFKTCTKCGDSKPVGSFHSDKRRKDGLFPQCKDCRKPYTREYSQRPEVKAAGLESHLARMKTRVCAIDECKNPTGAKLCAKHEARMRRHGDVNVVKTPRQRLREENHAWVGDKAGYSTVHCRLREWNGSAELYSCEHCGGPAKQWAYDHCDPNGKHSDLGPYSTNLEHYMTLCVPCHKRFDLARYA